MSARHKRKEAATPVPVIVDRSRPGVKLTEEQLQARAEILMAHGRSKRHLLSGHAGSGKTTTLVELVRALAGRTKLAVCAPTHKAVGVIARKLMDSGISGVPCSTLQSLMSLEPQQEDEDRVVWKRRKNPAPIDADFVIIDESSMIGAELYQLIERYLYRQFVLFVGDDAQLPPVNEDASPTFDTLSRSHLPTVIRQSADNPVLACVNEIRALQDHDDMDWSWMKAAKAPPKGVYLPSRDSLDTWLKKAFTSEDFLKDNDAFRVLCYTNKRVEALNRKVRYFIYGETPTPFSPGERVLSRSTIMRDAVVELATNEEAVVDEISEALYRHDFKDGPPGTGLKAWSSLLPAWRVKLLRDNGMEVTVYMPRKYSDVTSITARLADEARKVDRRRWRDLFAYKQSLADLRHVYAMTTHCSQGSTFQSTFVDVNDIRRCEQSDLLTCKRLLYVAATRCTTGLFFVV
jgi:predicted ATPase